MVHITFKKFQEKGSALQRFLREWISARSGSSDVASLAPRDCLREQAQDRRIAENAKVRVLRESRLQRKKNPSFPPRAFREGKEGI